MGVLQLVGAGTAAYYVYDWTKSRILREFEFNFKEVKKSYVINYNNKLYLKLIPVISIKNKTSSTVRVEKIDGQVFYGYKRIGFFDIKKLELSPKSDNDIEGRFYVPLAEVGGNIINLIASGEYLQNLRHETKIYTGISDAPFVYSDNIRLT